jgi:septal ring factor EnvC (AmiA/AmiB activator)
VPRRAPAASIRARRLRRALVVAALALALATVAPAQDQPDAAQRAAQEQAARQRLEAVRAELAALAAQQRATTDQRGEAVRALREQELALAAVAKDVHALDDKLAVQQAELDHLDGRRGELEGALRAQRAALAVLLRSAYALGHDEELKLLLQQDDVAAIARVLAYHRYFQRAQVGQIERLRGDLRELATLEATITAARAELAATRAARSAEGERLEAGRAERARRLEAMEGQLKDQAARIAALGRDETELTALIERLRDVFADIPRQLSGAQPFASLRGQLAWPLQGKVLTAFGAADDSGRRSSGLLLAARSGSAVHAVSHGRVAFADWLRGYGLMIIVDHGDGYLSLYGCNETLLKDVGDWVNAGETIATSGASGGQKAAGLYFELRAKGQPVDPRAWLR